MGIKAFLTYYFAKYIVSKNKSWKKNALSFQKNVFYSLLKKAKKTSFGKDHFFCDISNYEDWKKHVPIRDYEELREYIERVVAGEKNVVWPGRPLYLCKTSGTTSGVKHIPITKDSMPNHIVAARDAILTYVYETGNKSIVNGKMIFIQGSPKLKKTNSILTGRLSGIVAHHVPFYLQSNQLPSFKTNCIDDWEKKINKISEETEKENLTLISGIPPWVQMYFEKLKENTKKNIGDLFPNFQLFIYGGVNYSPYKKTFEKLIGKTVDGLELYPASEGFIAYQDSQEEKGLLLCVNHGIFYEFITVDSFFEEKQKRISLSEVKIGINYAVILNTNAGLFGYNIGDTVKFVSIEPYRIVVTGRIKHYTSAFGEHVIAEEVEGALRLSLEKVYAEIVEFHVAPQVNPKNGAPYHEWFIEFAKKPNDILLFEKILDKNLQNKNSYYRDLICGGVLKPLKICFVVKGGFKKYMSSVGRLGGQNKVPRLANERKIADKLILQK